ncbi:MULTISPECIES: MBL fold metallo-hydrolase [unclassified Inquilinus]|uniref:MBL fold metallo-hydrolase n=1 Tax=unclassified Inquilinus TaxID=2645927 RepID=UPI003F90E351
MAPALHFHGAAGTVTGSCLLLETSRGRMLVDCGLFQGSKTLKGLNYIGFPFRPAQVDCVLLTHAHIDHSGLIPKLARDGFRGPVYATRGTIDLCGVMLPDSGHIQESEVLTLNQRNQRRGRPKVTPIYTVADAQATLAAFRAVDYETWFEPLPGVRARYWNAGHILGSASIEIELAGEDGKPLRLLVSGDLGPDVGMLQTDRRSPADIDILVCEATYGDVDRPAITPEARREHLASEVRKAMTPQGVLIIPAFAVERTQELILDLVRLMDQGIVPKSPIYVDSPLAIRATDVFLRNHLALEDGPDFARALKSRQIHFAETPDQSRAINDIDGFRIVIAASGMCDAGRIRHHLKRHLWNPAATILLTGFQAQGTLGRLLQDGAKAVRIQGEDFQVRARIRMIEDYSGHTDGPELARWILDRQPIHQAVFLVHGERLALAAMKERVVEGVDPPPTVLLPQLDDGYRLQPGGPELIPMSQRPRILPEAVSSLDWHNERARLLLDIDARLEAANHDRARSAVLRHLRNALDES